MTLSREALTNWEFSLGFILDSTYNGVIAVDKNGYIVLINEAAKNLLQLKNSPIGLFIEEVIRDSLLPSVLRTGNAEVGHKIIINEHVCLANVSPILKNEEVVGAVTVFEDVTLLRRAIDDMYSSKELKGILRAVLDNSNEGIFITDETGSIIMCNDTLCNFFSIKKENVLGRNYHKIFPGFSISEVLKGGEYKLELRNIGGSDVIVANMPLLSSNKIVGAMGKILFKHVQEVNHLLNKLCMVKSKVSYYKEQLDNLIKSKYDVNNIVGKSQVLSQLRETIKKVAQGNSNVLFRGNSGTGKELLARALHFESPRMHGPFIKVNCASLPELLLERDLFGYEGKDGSSKVKEVQIGKIELANQGTLFLNEIGELSLNHQVKLLKFLHEQSLRRIGGSTDIPLDVRIVASTNKNLEDLVRANLFREDLYYSLSVLSFSVPPLRDRREDLEPIVNHLIQKYSVEFGKKVLGVSSEAYSLLVKHHWPGNVRELESVMERVFSVIDDQVIQPYHLPAYLKKANPVHLRINERNSLKSIMEDTERNVLIETLNNTGGNKVKAARLLGISRAGLYQKLEKYNLQDE